MDADKVQNTHQPEGSSPTRHVAVGNEPGTQIREPLSPSMARAKRRLEQKRRISARRISQGGKNSDNTDRNSHDTPSTAASSPMPPDDVHIDKNPSLNDSGLVQVAKSLWSELGNETQQDTTKFEQKRSSPKHHSHFYSVKPENSISLYPSLATNNITASVTTSATNNFLKETNNMSRQQDNLIEELHTISEEKKSHHDEHIATNSHESAKFQNSTTSLSTTTSEALVTRGPTIFEIFESRRKQRHQTTPLKPQDNDRLSATPTNLAEFSDMQEEHEAKEASSDKHLSSDTKYGSANQTANSSATTNPEVTKSPTIFEIFESRRRERQRPAPEKPQGIPQSETQQVKDDARDKTKDNDVIEGPKHASPATSSRPLRRNNRSLLHEIDSKSQNNQFNSSGIMPGAYTEAPGQDARRLESIRNSLISTRSVSAQMSNRKLSQHLSNHTRKSPSSQVGQLGSGSSSGGDSWSTMSGGACSCHPATPPSRLDSHEDDNNKTDDPQKATTGANYDEQQAIYNRKIAASLASVSVRNGTSTDPVIRPPNTNYSPHQSPVKVDKLQAKASKREQFPTAPHLIDDNDIMLSEKSMGPDAPMGNVSGKEEEKEEIEDDSIASLKDIPGRKMPQLHREETRKIGNLKSGSSFKENFDASFHELSKDSAGRLAHNMSRLALSSLRKSSILPVAATVVEVDAAREAELREILQEEIRREFEIEMEEFRRQLVLQVVSAAEPVTADVLRKSVAEEEGLRQAQYQRERTEAAALRSDRNRTLGQLWLNMKQQASNCQFDDPEIGGMMEEKTAKPNRQLSSVDQWLLVIVALVFGGALGAVIAIIAS